MKINARSSAQVLCYAICLIIFESLAHASTLNTGQFEAGKKAKVKGTIASRPDVEGNYAQIRRQIIAGH